MPDLIYIIQVPSCTSPRTSFFYQLAVPGVCMHFISRRWYDLMRSICSADVVWPYQRSTPCSHSWGKCFTTASEAADTPRRMRP